VRQSLTYKIIDWQDGRRIIREFVGVCRGERGPTGLEPADVPTGGIIQWGLLPEGGGPYNVYR
jgi:hypothetical protein